jgi:hypothetical protein
MKRLIYALFLGLLPLLSSWSDVTLGAEVAGLFQRRAVIQVPSMATCPAGVCPAAVATAVDPVVVVPSPKTAAIPPAAGPTLTIPGLTPIKPAAAPKPFPGPSVTAPRVLWVWDNGLIWEQGANVWRWQNEDGTWNQK